jgi:TolB-like protein
MLTMPRVKLLVVLGYCLVANAPVRAQSLDKELSTLAANLSKALASQNIRNVAALDFTDIQGQPTELGRFLSERITVEMVLAGGVPMLDRANIKSILAEAKLTQEGLVNPANAKKLGEFAGVEALLSGTVTSLDQSITLTVKAIATETSRILTAGRVTFPTTSDIQMLLNRGIFPGSSTAPTSGARPASGSAASYEEARGIATKDLGSLRVILKSVQPMQRPERQGKGLRFAFEFINRETQRSLLVAANAQTELKRHPSCSAECELLRSSLLDDKGAAWTLLGSGLTGLATVRAGEHGRIDCLGCKDSYPASDISRLLEMRDRLGSDLDPSDICPGTRQCGFRFVYSAPTTIAPGQTLAVTMDFALDSGGSAPAYVQINSELVVGVVPDDNKKSYSLKNLIFDRVSIPTSTRETRPRQR